MGDTSNSIRGHWNTRMIVWYNICAKSICTHFFKCHTQLFRNHTHHVKKTHKEVWKHTKSATAAQHLMMKRTFTVQEHIMSEWWTQFQISTHKFRQAHTQFQECEQSRKHKYQSEHTIWQQHTQQVQSKNTGCNIIYQQMKQSQWTVQSRYMEREVDICTLCWVRSLAMSWKLCSVPFVTWTYWTWHLLPPAIAAKTNLHQSQEFQQAYSC